MMVNEHGLPLAGTLVARDHEGWSAELRAEFAANAHNGRVGGRLLSETDRVRVWEIRLAPGERLPAHRHVLDYFWTALTAGRGRQHTADGTTREVTYEAGRPGTSRSGPASSCCTTWRTAVTPRCCSPPSSSRTPAVRRKGPILGRVP